MGLSIPLASVMLCEDPSSSFFAGGFLIAIDIISTYCNYR